MTLLKDSKNSNSPVGDIDKYRSKPVATAGWLIAGIPLLITTIQAIGALTSHVGEWPILGPIAQSIHTIEVFRQASLRFIEAPVEITSLFLLFSIAWVGLGLSLFRPTNTFKNHIRNLRRVSALTSTVFFIGLYIAIYRDIWLSSLPIISRLSLFVLPIPTLLGIYIAYRLQPKTNSQQLLDEAEALMETKRTDLMSSLNDQLDHRNSEVKSKFKDLINEDYFIVENNNFGALEYRVGENKSIFDLIDDYRSASISEHDREEAARKLLENEVKPFDPENKLEDISKKIGEKLAEQIDSDYVDYTITSSRWDQAYDLVNHDEYRSFHASVADTEYHELSPIHINEIETVSETFKSDLSGTIGATIALYLEIEDHFKFITNDLNSRRSNFIQEYDNIDDILSSSLESVSKLKPNTMAQIERLPSESNSLSSNGEILLKSSSGEGHLDKAVELHHDCLFNDAQIALERAENLTNDYRDVVKFVDQLTTVIEDQGQQLNIRGVDISSNPYFKSTLTNEKFKRTIEKEYSCRLEVDDINQLVKISYGNESEQDSVDVIENHPETSNEINEARIQNGAEHVFRAIAQGDLNMETSPDGHCKIQTENIPRFYSITPVLSEVREFLEEQDDLVSEVRLQDGAPPGYLEFDFNSGDSSEMVKETLLNRYTDRITPITNP